MLNFIRCIPTRGAKKKSKVGFEISTQWFPILLYLDRHHAKFQGPRCLGSAPSLTPPFSKGRIKGKYMKNDKVAISRLLGHK